MENQNENEQKLQYIADTIGEAEGLVDRASKEERVPKPILKAMKIKLIQSREHLIELNIKDKQQKKHIDDLIKEIELLKTKK